MALRVTKDLLVEFVARKHLPLLDEPIMAAPLSIYGSLMQSLCHTPTLKRFYSDNADINLYLLTTAWKKLTPLQGDMRSGSMHTHHLNSEHLWLSTLGYTLNLIRHLHCRWTWLQHPLSLPQTKPTLQVDSNINISISRMTAETSEPTQ